MNLILYSKLEPQINLDTQERINKALLEIVNNDDATVGLIEHTTDKENKYYKLTTKLFFHIGNTLGIILNLIEIEMKCYLC